MCRLLGYCYSTSEHGITILAAVFSVFGKFHSITKLFSLSILMIQASEKEKEETAETVLGPKDGRTANRQIVPIITDLDGLIAQDKCDSYLLYLYGMLKHKLNDMQAAQQMLIRAINLEPQNWAAWQELSSLMTDTATVSAPSTL